MRKIRCTGMVKAFFFVVVLILASPVFAQDEDEMERRSWYIGFGIGGGLGAAFNIDGNDISFNDWFYKRGLPTPKFSLNFKLGLTINPRLLLGLDLTALGQLGDGFFERDYLQINNCFVMATYFPFEKGLLLRTGAGLASFVYMVDDSREDHEHIREIYNGFGGLAGIGYSFWVGRQFNLTVNLDHSMQSYNNADGPDSSRSTMLYLSFDWYYVRKMLDL